MSPEQPPRTHRRLAAALDASSPADGELAEVVEQLGAVGSACRVGDLEATEVELAWLAGAEAAFSLVAGVSFPRL